MRTPAPRAPLGSPPAADTHPGVLQQTRAVWGAGAALPRCLGPRSADLKRAPSNFSKSGRDGRHGAAAQHTHYGAVHMEAGQPRAIRSSSAPPGACSARSRAPHVLFSQFSPDFREGKLNYFPQSHTRQHSCFVAQHIVWANRTAHLHGASRGTDALVSFSLSCSDRP